MFQNSPAGCAAKRKTASPPYNRPTEFEPSASQDLKRLRCVNSGASEQEQTPALNGSCGVVDSFNGLMSGVVFDAPNEAGFGGRRFSDGNSPPSRQLQHQVGLGASPLPRRQHDGLGAHQQSQQQPLVRGCLEYSSNDGKGMHFRALSCPQSEWQHDDAQHRDYHQQQSQKQNQHQQQQQQPWQQALQPVPPPSHAPAPGRFPLLSTDATVQRSHLTPPASRLQQSWPPVVEAAVPACSISCTGDLGGPKPMDEDSPGLRHTNSAPDLHMALQEPILAVPQTLLGGQTKGSSSTVGALVPYAHPVSTKGGMLF